MRRAAGYQDDLAYAPPVPNLPGYTHAQNLLSQTQAMHGIRRGKTTTLKFVNNKAVVEDNVALAGSASQVDLRKYNRLPEQEPQPQHPQHRQEQQLPATAPAQYSDGKSSNQDTWGVHTVRWTGAKTPGWLKYGSKVLRFFAYSTDQVLYSPVEEVRVRQFELRYHLQDDTLEILEPQTANSGLPQGRYLHRQKVALKDGSLLKHQSLRVGAELIIFSRRFMLVGCDAATRQCMEQELGIAQPPDQPMPSGEFDATRKAQEEAELLRRRQRALQASKGGKTAEDVDDPFECPPGPSAVFDFWEDDRVPEHLENKLLRFFCMWDNTKTVLGQKLGFALHYYLKDDTIEVVELHRRNTGRDPFPLLLRRCKLPKTPNIPPVSGRPLSPRSKRILNIQYYHWTDISIGDTVKVYGRDLLVYDADASTKAWLKEQLQLRPEQLAAVPVDFDCGPKRPPLQVPPNTLGIGTDEDSLQNVLHLIPKRPARDYANYMDNWNKVLRFSARMVPGHGGDGLVGPFDAERRFIISFYLLDMSLSIYEPKRPNSGMKGGMFLEHMKVKKHKQDAYFSPEDFQVGTTICVYARHYELLDADAFTLRHMETEPHRFPHADLERVLAKVLAATSGVPGLLQALRAQLHQHDTEGLGYLNHKQLKAAMDSAGVQVSAHEAITLVRGLGADMEGLVVEQLLQALSGAADPAVPGGNAAVGGVPGSYQAGPAVPDLQQADAAGPSRYQPGGAVPRSYAAAGNMPGNYPAAAATPGSYAAGAAVPDRYKAGAAVPSSYPAAAAMPPTNPAGGLQQQQGIVPQQFVPGMPQRPRIEQPRASGYQATGAGQHVDTYLNAHQAQLDYPQIPVQQQPRESAVYGVAGRGVSVGQAVAGEQQAFQAPAAHAGQPAAVAQRYPPMPPVPAAGKPHEPPQRRFGEPEVSQGVERHFKANAAAGAQKVPQPPFTAWQNAQVGAARVAQQPASAQCARPSDMYPAPGAPAAGRMNATTGPAAAAPYLTMEVQPAYITQPTNGQHASVPGQSSAAPAAAMAVQPNQARRAVAWQAGAVPAALPSRMQDMQVSQLKASMGAQHPSLLREDAGSPGPQAGALQGAAGWAPSVPRVQQQQVQSKGLIAGQMQPLLHESSPGVQAQHAAAWQHAAPAQHLYEPEWQDARHAEHVYGHGHVPQRQALTMHVPAVPQHGLVAYEQEDDIAATGRPYDGHAAYHMYDQDSKPGRQVLAPSHEQAWDRLGAAHNQAAQGNGQYQGQQQAYKVQGAGHHMSSKVSDSGRSDLSVRAAQPNRAVLEQVSKQKQPASLWQTTNSALGGVHSKSITRRGQQI